MINFIKGVIGLSFDIVRAIRDEIVHKKDCAMKTDDVPHRCTCGRR